MLRLKAAKIARTTPESGIIRRTKFKPWHIASPRHREAIVSAAAGVGVSSGSFHGR